MKLKNKFPTMQELLAAPDGDQTAYWQQLLGEWQENAERELAADLEFDLSEERLAWTDDAPELNKIHDRRSPYKVEHENMSNELTIPDDIDDGWGDAAAEASDRVLQGQLLKFTDGTWTYGQLATIMPESIRLIAHAVTAAWVRWEGGKPVQYEVHKGAIWKDRDQLGYHDEARWENGPDGKPRDPWQKTKFVYLMEPNSAEAYTFTTSSASGLGAVGDLATTIARKRFSGRKVLPLVQLDRAPMKTKFGMKRKPVFKIMDWVLPDGSRDAPAIQPKQIEHNPAKVAPYGDMDDEIPL